MNGYPYASKDIRERLTKMRYDLANRVENLIKQYVIFDNDLEATAVTLWVFGTYLMDGNYGLNYISPEENCKTELLSFVEALSKDGQMASNISLSTLNRIIDRKRPTLCIDEADLFLRKSDDSMEL